MANKVLCPMHPRHIPAMGTRAYQGGKSAGSALRSSIMIIHGALVQT